MIDFIKRNDHFLLILLSWVVIGMFAAPAMLGVIPLSLLLFKQKNRFAEMLIGFFFILMLSDSRQPEFKFAQNVKGYLFVAADYFHAF